MFYFIKKYEEDQITEDIELRRKHERQDHLKNHEMKEDQQLDEDEIQFVSILTKIK